jgi:hypothetical protein
MVLYNQRTRTIDLSNKNLKEIPIEVFQYKNVRKLLLRNNRIKKIPKEIEELRFLVTLDLSVNEISQIHPPICKLDRLKILILNHNKIKRIPKQIMEMKSLKILGLSNNQFKELPSEISFLKNLKELYVNNNRLIQIPNLIQADSPKFKFSFKGNPLITQSPKKNNNDAKISKTDNPLSSTRTTDFNTHKKIFFVSYSHIDKKWKDKVMAHLKSLENVTGHEIFPWSDEDIPSGGNIEANISDVLNKSVVGILLFSANYLASNFITRKEIPPMIKKRQDDGMILKCIIIGKCLYNKIPSFSNIKAVNDINLPLNKIKEGDQDEVLNGMCENLISELQLNPIDFE